MRRFFVFIILIVCFSPVFCVNYDYLHISSEIFPDYTEQEIIIGVKNNKNITQEEFFFLLGEAPDDLKVFHNNEEVNHALLMLNNVPSIKIIDELSPNSTKEYVITYDSELVESVEDYFLFSYSFTSYYNISDYKYEVILPQGYGIVRKGGSSISPSPSNLYSDGQQIIINWIEPLSYGEENAYLFFFQQLSTQNNSFVLIFFFGIIGLLAGGMITYLFLRSKRKELVVMALSDDEKKVFDMVSKNPKGVYQNKLLKPLDFSKSKLSKIVNNLSSKNIIRIERSGRKNILKLSDKII